MKPHSDESVERAAITLREITQELRWRGISAVMILEEQIKALEEYRKDAERYRWLRDTAIYTRGPVPYCVIGTNPHDAVPERGDALDAAIDAAMAAKEGGAA